MKPRLMTPGPVQVASDALLAQCGHLAQPGAAAAAVHATVNGGSELRPLRSLVDARLPVTELA